MVEIRGRLGAVLLLVAFVGGGPGLSVLDAVLFHSRGEAVRADVAHVDPPGGCGAHVERCVLGATMAGPQLVELGLVKVRDAGVISLTAAFRPSTILRSTARNFLYASRAPPAPAC